MKSKQSLPQILRILLVAVIAYQGSLWGSAFDYKKQKQYKKFTAFQTSSEVLGLLDEALKYMKRGWTGQAKATLRKALEIHPNYVKTLSFYAYIEFLNGNNDQAIVIAEKILKIQESNKMANMTIALAKLNQQYIPEARRIFNYLAKIYPKDWKPHYQLGIINRMEEKLPEAIKSFDHCIYLSYESMACHNELALTYSLQGRVERAYRTLADVLNTHPHHIPSYVTLTNIVNQTGRYRHHTYELLRQGIVFNRNSRELYIVMADLLRGMGKFKASNDYRRKALTLAPTGANNAEVRGYRLKKMGKLEESAVVFEKLLTKEPGNIFAHYHLATIYRKKGNVESCIDHYKTILKDVPDHFLSVQGLGLCYLKGRHMVEAHRFLLQSVQMKPKHVDACTNLGVFYQVYGQNTKAVERLTKCLDIQDINERKRLAIKQRIVELRSDNNAPVYIPQ